MGNEKIRIAVIGVGNCASALIQGISYYSKNSDGRGLIHFKIGEWRPQDIEVVAAFDIDKRKVGKRLKDAIFTKPNCTAVFCPELIDFDVEVMMGHILDGYSPHMADFDEEKTVIPADREPVDVAKVLKETGAEVLVNYVPVGSESAARYYAQACIEAGVAFINCMPTFIVSDPEWGRKFKEVGIPAVGDDIKSQVGATITHRTLARLLEMRGIIIERTYQLNVGGNTDFLNMLDRSRLKTKKVSKTEAVRSIVSQEIHDDVIHIGPSDYVPWLKDKKLCFLRLEGRGFGGVPLNIELRLDVEDSPNSAACVIDAIRCAKLALERGISGPIISISAFTMKHPPRQIPDEEAAQLVDDFIAGKIDW